MDGRSLPQPIQFRINNTNNYHSKNKNKIIAKLRTMNATPYVLHYLIDCGSEVSIIKVKNIGENKLNTNEKISLIGIGEGRQTTLGTVNLTIELPKEKIYQKFHVVDDNFNITTEAIIGMDLLKSMKIDFQQNILDTGITKIFLNNALKEIEEEIKLKNTQKQEKLIETEIKTDNTKILLDENDIKEILLKIQEEIEFKNHFKGNKKNKQLINLIEKEIKNINIQDKKVIKENIIHKVKMNYINRKINEKRTTEIPTIYKDDETQIIDHKKIINEDNKKENKIKIIEVTENQESPLEKYEFQLETFRIPKRSNKIIFPTLKNKISDTFIVCKLERENLIIGNSIVTPTNTNKIPVSVINTSENEEKIQIKNIHIEKYEEKMHETKNTLTFEEENLPNDHIIDFEDEEILPNDHAIDIPDDEKLEILKEVHDSKLGGHRGIKATIEAAKEIKPWKGMNSYIKNYITKCEKCQFNKRSIIKKTPMIITDTPLAPIDKIAIDLCGPFPTSESGNTHLLTIQCMFSKFTTAIGIPDESAKTVAEKLLEHFIFKYGMPQQILSDKGTNFCSKLIKNWCKMLNIEKINTSPYHPQSNGSLERYHDTLKTNIRHYINNQQSNWDELASYSCFVYNTTKNTSTGYKPITLINGRDVILPTSFKEPIKIDYNYDDYVLTVKNKFRKIYQDCRENLTNSKEKTKIRFDKNTKIRKFKIGDLVLKQTKQVRLGRSKKLGNQWLGPYKILEQLGETTYKIKKGRKVETANIDNLKGYYE
jgi:transposase InsO family protein